MVVFVDGQNLFHSAREAFGYPYLNGDAGKLATIAERLFANLDAKSDRNVEKA
ncbi:MAG: hypothetical protein ACYDDA_14510 [Acidiferrobacteraceae bacterium]